MGDKNVSWFKKRKNGKKEQEFEAVLASQCKIVAELPVWHEKLFVFCSTTFFTWLPFDLQQYLHHFLLSEQYELNNKYLELYKTVGDFLYDSNGNKKKGEKFVIVPIKDK